MTLGYGGKARLKVEDEQLVVYSYGCYNCNNDDWEKYKNIEDGEIYIEKNSFVEPEIHQKLKRMPSGKKKLIVKRVPNDVPVEEYLESGKITFKNASGTWKINKFGIDIMAFGIIISIFDEYQETGEIPKFISYFK